MNNQAKKKRGRPAPPKGIDVYAGCGRMSRYRDGKLVPCSCPSCVDQSRK